MYSLEKKRLDLAYSKLGMKEPFIAAAVSGIERKIDRLVPTAATNGEWVMFNPDFMAEQSDAQLFGLVVHECLHIVLMHMWRRENRDAHLWNYANDALINAYCKARGYMLPEGGVFVSWVTEAMSSEEVYDKLRRNPPPPPPQGNGEDEGDGEGNGDGEGEGDDGNQGNSGGASGDSNDGPDTAGNGSGSGGDPRYPRGGFGNSGDIFDAPNEATKADLESKILAAAKMAKQCGQGSSLIDRIIDSVGKPNVSWAEVLRMMMSESSRDDYTMARPRRRYISQDLYLASLHSDAIGGLLIGFDVSGSVNEEEANQIAAEVRAIAADTNPSFIEVVYCTDVITKIERFDEVDDLVLKPVGSGGTRFKPVFDHLEQSDDDFVGMVYFTDMCGDLNELIEPEIPVIWADTYGKAEAPFGTKVKVNL